ncbi:aminoacyl-tRNA hydrolase [Ascoidea rubescens DSM 1968]|uniref:Peptidyl-tRNA hydrolase n=1 Tax=Ascoidea rubescens DSM 1968 TaxID=1344418 RepID=A0A1D2VP05_9ASCO|nr:peptidyl-tRNA hydrolase [Ascoidea rubescens DSM 1968]ODV63340.1 peptidyl-tRNA hydrolase [Ascoidea rubescens DSM 1968]
MFKLFKSINSLNSLAAKPAKPTTTSLILLSNSTKLPQTTPKLLNFSSNMPKARNYSKKSKSNNQRNRNNNNTNLMRNNSLFSVDPNKPPLLILSSVGNPENQFGLTRHNAGHIILNYLKLIYNYPNFSKLNGFSNGVVSRFDSPSTNNLILYKSTNYMNESAKSFASQIPYLSNQFGNFYNICLVVIHDELSLPLGKIQIRKRCSSPRGHNGLKSIQSSNIGANFITVSIGIGRPDSRDPNVVSDYVLSNFNNNELLSLNQTATQLYNHIEQMKLGQYVYEINDN